MTSATKSLFITTVAFLMLFSCNHFHNSKDTEVANIIKSMVGKNVSIPELTSTYLGRDSSFPRNDSTFAKLIVYYDSSACQTCRVNTLYEWKDIIAIENKYRGMFKLMIIFAPAQEDITNLRRALARSRFIHPVYFDYNGRLLKDNEFIHHHQAFHTFLLDKNNNIVLVGDPVANPAMYPLLIKTLSILKDFEKNSLSLHKGYNS